MGAEDEEHKIEAKEKPSPNPITQAQFLSWKRLKDADASARKAEVARKRAEDIAAGTVQMNGRELFLHQPEASIEVDFRSSRGICSLDESAYE